MTRSQRSLLRWSLFSFLISAFFIGIPFVRAQAPAGEAWYAAPDGKLDIQMAVVSKNKNTKQIPLNRLVSLIVHTRSRDNSVKIETFTFNATMPAHKHGMFTKAKTTRISDSEFRVDGVKLHMSGTWVLEFSFVTDKGLKIVTVPYEMK